MRVISISLWILTILMAVGAVRSLLPKGRPPIVVRHVPPVYAQPQGPLKCSAYKKLQGLMSHLTVGMKMKTVIEILGPPSGIIYAGPKSGNEETTNHWILELRAFAVSKQTAGVKIASYYFGMAKALNSQKPNLGRESSTMRIR